jgi:hypothetical protein
LQIKGVPINVAKYLMGHSDISVTANIYTHITDEAIRQAAELIGVTFGVSSGEKGEDAIEKPPSPNEKTA